MNFHSETHFFLASRIRRALFWLIGSLRKTDAPTGLSGENDKMLAELERLAETSPHLLTDLGFQHEQTGREDVTTWGRGDLRVEETRGSWAFHRAFFNPRG